MLNPSNGFSFLRAPLALLFIIENAFLRAFVILLAMLSDCIDGYLARRYHYTSRFGTALDPIMDKFFVYVALLVLFRSHQIALWQIGAILTRDCFLFIFMLYLRFLGNWKTFQLRSIRWGKITTASQFLILLAIVLKVKIPNFVYYFFILFGLFAFLELCQFAKKAKEGS